MNKMQESLCPDREFNFYENFLYFMFFESCKFFKDVFFLCDFKCFGPK